MMVNECQPNHQQIDQFSLHRRHPMMPCVAVQTRGAMTIIGEHSEPIILHIIPYVYSLRKRDSNINAMWLPAWLTTSCHSIKAALGWTNQMCDPFAGHATMR
jgi:hypothetical protein